MSIFIPGQRTPEQQVYAELVDKLSFGRENKEISNGKPEHAVYLIARLFAVARSKVRLYSDHLKHAAHIVPSDESSKKIDIYGAHEVISNAANFLLKEGTSLEIVVENDLANLATHPLVKALQKVQESGGFSNKVHIKKLTEEAHQALITAKFDYHFMVADDNAYRIETDENPINFKARANFNDTEYGSGLVRMFDSFHFENSKEVLAI